MQHLPADNGAGGHSTQTGPDEPASRNGRTILRVPKGPEQACMRHTSSLEEKGRRGCVNGKCAILPQSVAVVKRPSLPHGYWSDHSMRISTVREFRETTGLLRSRTPILVTRRGRVAGIFLLPARVRILLETLLDDAIEAMRATAAAGLTPAAVGP